MPPSALKSSPGTAAKQDLVAYLEGRGTGCLLTIGMPHWGTALQSAGLLDPLAFCRTPGAAYVAPTFADIDGEDDPPGDAAPDANCKSVRLDQVRVLMEKISNAANDLDGERAIPADGSPRLLAELHTISSAFAEMKADCQLEATRHYAERVATPRKLTARIEEPVPPPAADGAKPRPLPKAAAGLGRAESDALRSNAARSLGLPHGYPTKGAPLDECVESIWLEGRRQQPRLPTWGTMKVGWERDGKPILARDRDGGYLKHEALPSAKGPSLIALLREKTCAFEALGLAHSFDDTDPAYQHYEFSPRDSVGGAETEGGEESADLRLGCQFPELRELDREIDAACLDPNEDGDIASAYQADKLIRRVWNKLSVALTEEGKVRTLTQAIERVRRRQGDELLDLVADKKPERKSDPDSGGGRNPRGAGKERRRDSRSPRRDRSRSRSPSRGRGTKDKPKSSRSYDTYSRPGNTGGASSSNKPELFGQKHRDACSKAGLCHAHMKHLKHNGSPCAKFKAGECKYKHFSQADADDFYTDQDLS